MKRLPDQEREWMDKLDESTNPQEILELSKNLKMKLTPENAQTIAEAHARIIARRTAQDELEEPKNPWVEYYEAKSQSEKEAILKKILPDITSKELEIMRRKMPVPEEPEKGFMELLLEAISTEDSTQKEAIYEKIVEQEIKRLQAEKKRGDHIKKKTEKGSPHLKIVGMIPASDEERIHLMKTLLHFTDEKAREMLERMKARKPPYIKIEEGDAQSKGGE